VAAGIEVIEAGLVVVTRNTRRSASYQYGKEKEEIKTTTVSRIPLAVLA
jgi:hypothetical protein